ncbi:hypothetical protein Q8791_30445 [Nocardiopsis sp. CT-R113]|uniref:Uncharacterized protein n=1 Tax=Nocardiopsis codii TaxID=3065942 RepID=A0ABU7KH60_9ACTN|nr:hypothetical protein [Nocardiopsis sp. CT-R113]MEE2041550.1 hypothetical protein [Nocardiopsis sp. CT-R113]
MDHEHRDEGDGDQELPALDPQGRPYVGTPRITTTTRTRLVSRTCGWCGDPVPYSGRGRPATYCSKAHRNRQWEVNSARRRQERDQAAGTARPEDEPVREVIRETVTRTATRSARIEVPVPAPGRVRTVEVEVPVEVERPVRLETPMEVCAVLSGVEAAVREGRFPEDGLDHVLRRAVALTEAIRDARIWED